jgi:hypothetical protein
MARIWRPALLPVVAIRTEAGFRDPDSPVTGTVIGHCHWSAHLKRQRRDHRGVSAPASVRTYFAFRLSLPI